MIDRKHLGEMLKILRQENKLTQEKLEELTDIDQRQIARYESGACYPKLDNFIKICRVLNADISKVLNYQANDDLNKENIVANLAKMSPRQLNLAKKIIQNIAEEC